MLTCAASLPGPCSLRAGCFCPGEVGPHTCHVLLRDHGKACPKDEWKVADAPIPKVHQSQPTGFPYKAITYMHARQNGRKSDTLSTGIDSQHYKFETLSKHWAGRRSRSQCEICHQEIFKKLQQFCFEHTLPWPVRATAAQPVHRVCFAGHAVKVRECSQALNPPPRFSNNHVPRLDGRRSLHEGILCRDVVDEVQPDNARLLGSSVRSQESANGR